MAVPELSTNYNIKPGQSSNRAADTKNDLERGQKQENNNKIIKNNKNNPRKKRKTIKIITNNNKNKKNKKNNKRKNKNNNNRKMFKAEGRPARKTAIKAEVLLGRKGSR